MGDTIKCEKCGAVAEYRVTGSTKGVFCTECDWAIVTTHIPKIQQDITKYKIVLLHADINNKHHIKAIADITGRNFRSKKNNAKRYNSNI
jgi:hypothetical protein